MEQLIKQIEQWAEDRNIINGTKPIDQSMKLFSEFGELADNVGKGRDCRDDIGDVFVVLTIMCKQYGMCISNADFTSEFISKNNKNTVVLLGSELIEISILNSVSMIDFDDAISSLIAIAESVGSTLEECVQIAYNDIKNRKGKVVNGVFIKESDLKDGE